MLKGMPAIALQKEGGMRCAVREMDVEVVDLVSREEFSEIGGVSARKRGFDLAAILFAHVWR